MRSLGAVAEGASPDAEAELWRLVEHAVLDELRHASAFYGDLELTDEQLASLAWAVTTRLDYAFNVRWDPDWVKEGEAHTWVEDGQVFARCTRCLAMSPPCADREAAVAWHVEHAKTHTANELGATS